MAQSKYLKQNGEVIYPITTIENVLDAAGNSISNLNYGSGYCVLPSGLILQWGHDNVGHATRKTITFPTAFTNQCFMVVASVSQNGYSSTTTISTGDHTKTNFEVWGYSGASAAMGFNWIAIGF